MRKILLAVGALVLVIILAFVALGFNKDKTGPAMSSLLINQRVIIDAANEATTKATSSRLQNDVANVSTVVLSNHVQASSYYLKSVNKKLPSAEGATLYKEVTKLQAAVAGPAYDEAVLKLLKERLQANVDNLKTIYSQTKSNSLKELANQIYKDQAALLSNL